MSDEKVVLIATKKYWSLTLVNEISSHIKRLKRTFVKLA